MDAPNHHKRLTAPLRAAQYDFEEGTVRAALDDLLVPDAPVRLPHPYPEMRGADAFYGIAYAPLLRAWPDLERRDTIVMAGSTPRGADWVGMGGYYTGTFAHSWHDIPPTGHQAAMRFHEFYRFEEGRAVEVQALWDIPEVMLQSDLKNPGAWPLAPSLGREWHVPGPATRDGLVPGPYDEAASLASRQHIIDMLAAMTRHPSQGGPEVMEMERYWHPRMSWYGPSGIGTGRGIRGFRAWHQIPFLSGMPDRGGSRDEIEEHFFADGPYAAVTGWPDMIQSHTGPGWLGLAPTGKRFEARSLDFWRIENGLIRENWVLLDLLHIHDQLGLDVLARMREFNKARMGFDPETGRAL